jgi:hypothetical protein
MKTLWKHATIAAVMVLGATFTVPSNAAAVDATLYELTENMGLDDLANPTVRTAMAALQGTARSGSALCPPALVALLRELGLITAVTSPAKPCTVTAVGTDEIDLATGGGTLSGTFSVVVNADNVVDGAELVVMEGNFAGNMQLLFDTTATPPRALPLIAIPCSGPTTCGTLTPTKILGVPLAYLGYYFPGVTAEMFPAAAFGGVFRLPFVQTNNRGKAKARRNVDASYLTDEGKTVKVKPNELSLGMPTVRVEITFAP